MSNLLENEPITSQLLEELRVTSISDFMQVQIKFPDFTKLFGVSKEVLASLPDNTVMREIAALLQGEIAEIDELIAGCEIFTHFKLEIKTDITDDELINLYTDSKSNPLAPDPDVSGLRGILESGDKTK